MEDSTHYVIVYLTACQIWSFISQTWQVWCGAVIHIGGPKTKDGGDRFPIFKKIGDMCNASVFDSLGHTWIQSIYIHILWYYHGS